MSGPWLDFVHLVGIAGGVLALAALAGGLYLLLGFRKARRIALRMKVRGLHMGGGAAAVLLAVGHAAGRALQTGEVELDLNPTLLTVVAFVGVLATGLLRQYPPGVLQGHFKLLAWLHRLAVVAALALLALHAYRAVMSYAL
jgi:hypothetical protein